MLRRLSWCGVLCYLWAAPVGACDPCAEPYESPFGLTWEYPLVEEESIDLFVVYYRPAGSGMFDWEEQFVWPRVYGKRGLKRWWPGLDAHYVLLKDTDLPVGTQWEIAVTAIDIGRPESGMSNIVTVCVPDMCTAPFVCTDGCL